MDEMKEEGMSMEEIRAYAQKKQQEKIAEESVSAPTENVVEEKSINEQKVEEVKVAPTQVVAAEEKKSITDISAQDIKFKLDSSKTMEQQAEDVVGAIATAKAVQDEKTAQELTEKKSEELKAKAETKRIQASTEETNAVVSQQEANRIKNEAVLQTFGINKHLPDWLLKIMVFLFSPLYVLLSFIIGVPCGVVKVLIDDIDNILVTYEKTESQGKRKIKTTVWIVLILAVLALAAFVILKCVKVI